MMTKMKKNEDGESSMKDISVNDIIMEVIHGSNVPLLVVATYTTNIKRVEDELMIHEIILT